MGKKTFVSVSSGRLVSIRQLARLIEEYIGKPINARWGALPYPSRQIMKATTTEPKLPNWDTSVSLEEGIGRVAEAIKPYDVL